MGDVSVMARRLPDGHIEYGWSGNGGYFRSVGKMFLLYDTDELADDLFRLGQLFNVGMPGSEHGLLPEYMRNLPIGSPMYHGDSESNMFDRIVGVDYGYLRELDGEWYSINPGPFCVKMPLRLVGNHLDERGFKYDFWREVDAKITEYMLTDFVAENEDFRAYLVDAGIDPTHIREHLKGSDYPLYDLDKHYSNVSNYFDEWIVVDCDADYQEVTSIHLRKKVPDAQRQETCTWYQPTSKKSFDNRKIVLEYYASYIDYCHSAFKDGNYPKSRKDMTSRDLLLYTSLKDGKYERGVQSAKKEGYQGLDVRGYAASYVYGSIEVFEEIFRNIMSADDEEDKRKIIGIIARKKVDTACYTQKYLVEDPLFASKVQNPFTADV